MYEFSWGEKGATLQQTRVIAAKMFDVFREEIIEQLLSESTLDDNSDADESHSTETEDN